MMALSIIIPAYDEEKSIKETLEEVLTFCKNNLKEYQVIVVDDASADNTPAIAARYGEVTVMKNPVNIGYGGSIKKALSEARYEHVLIMDADGTYSVGEIKKLLPFVGDFDMVVGARQGRHYRGSLMKRFSRFLFYLLLKYVTGESIPDANSGLRIFKKSVVMKFTDDLCSGFSFTTTITIIMLSNQYLIKFIPIEYKKRIGKSKVRFVRDSLRTIQILLQNISYYNPIKAFLPFSAVSILAAEYFALRYVIADLDVYLLCAVIFSVSSMLFFAFGLMGHIIVTGKRNRS